MSQTAKQVKAVQIIARFQFKSDARKVVYQVRSSDGQKKYETTLFASKATACTCESRKPCKHMKQMEVVEANRVAAENDKTFSQAVSECLDTFYEVRFSNVCGHRVKGNIYQSCGCDA